MYVISMGFHGDDSVLGFSYLLQVKEKLSNSELRTLVQLSLP